MSVHRSRNPDRRAVQRELDRAQQEAVEDLAEAQAWDEQYLYDLEMSTALTDLYDEEDAYWAALDAEDALDAEYEDDLYDDPYDYDFYMESLDDLRFEDLTGSPANLPKTPPVKT